MPGVPNVMAALKRGMASGVLYAGYPYAHNQWLVTGGSVSAPNFGSRVDSLADLFRIMEPGDVAMIGPGFYDEPGLVIPEGLNNITLIGAGSRGSVGLEVGGVGEEGLTVLADDVTLINFGCSAPGDFSLKIGNTTVSPARFRASGCKFEGNETVNPGAQVIFQGSGDCILDDCEIAWGVNGILGNSNNDGFPTQTLIRNCWFHDLTTVHVGVAGVAHWIELWLQDNRFDRDEAGVAPTDFLLLSDNANIGSITGNRFANATNQAAVITIGTGLLYMANATEAGWSTARPA